MMEAKKRIFRIRSCAIEKYSQKQLRWALRDAIRRHFVRGYCVPPVTLRSVTCTSFRSAPMPSSMPSTCTIGCEL